MLYVRKTFSLVKLSMLTVAVGQLCCGCHCYSPVGGEAVLAGNIGDLLRDGMRKNYGDSASLQHLVIIRAILGNRALRPREESPALQCLTANKHVSETLDDLQAFLAQNTEDEEMQGVHKWCTANFSEGAEPSNLLKAISDDVSLLHFISVFGNATDIKTALKAISDSEGKNGSLISKTLWIRSLFDIENDDNEVGHTIRSIRSSSKRNSVISLFHEVHTAITEFEVSLRRAEEEFNEALENTNIYSDDIVTRVEALESLVAKIAEFLSFKTEVQVAE